MNTRGGGLVTVRRPRVHAAVGTEDAAVRAALMAAERGLSADEIAEDVVAGQPS